MRKLWSVSLNPQFILCQNTTPVSNSFSSNTINSQVTLRQLFLLNVLILLSIHFGLSLADTVNGFLQFRLLYFKFHLNVICVSLTKFFDKSLHLIDISCWDHICGGTPNTFMNQFKRHCINSCSHRLTC